MLHKVETRLEFDNKRNPKLITPCCHKINSNGKFVTYKGFPDLYGYCHSCDITTAPPTLFLNSNGDKFFWNKITKEFEPHVLQLSYDNVIHSCNTKTNKGVNNIKYIDFKVVTSYYEYAKENNLFLYLRNTYSNVHVNMVKKRYYVGTNKKLWTVFWYINRDGRAQKAKVCYYTTLGKRTDLFKVPYKNDDGYYGCLYGEHLLKENSKPIILVESEKTAIVASIVLPHYTWLAYSGINGLTERKIKALTGETIIIIPDISSKAVKIMHDKKQLFERYKINAKIFDMRNGLTDEQLKVRGWYNADVEDVFRHFTSKII